MSTVIEQVKNAAYTSVGVNLLVTDAIVGREPAEDWGFTHLDDLWSPTARG